MFTPTPRNVEDIQATGLSVGDMPPNVVDIQATGLILRDMASPPPSVVDIQVLGMVTSGRFHKLPHPAHLFSIEL